VSWGVAGDRSMGSGSSNPGASGLNQASTSGTCPRVVILGPAESEWAALRHWALSRAYSPIACETCFDVSVALVPYDPALVVVFQTSEPSSNLHAVAKLRAAHPRVAIVCVADPSEAGDVLIHGATDFFLRPYRIEELLTRLTARAEQLTFSEEDTPDTVGRRSGRVRLGGKAITLHPAARRILAYLSDHAGRAVSVTELQSEVLHTKGISHSVHNHVCEIRKALKAAGLPDFIRTHRGAGCFSISTSDAGRFLAVSSNDG
jgi:DNA-binding response OmpR family regulator